MAKYKSKLSFWSTTKNDPVPKYPNMTSIIFTNGGNVDAFINEVYALPAGTSSPGISTGHPDNLFDLDLRISFNPASAGTNPFVQAIIIETFEERPKSQERGIHSKNCEFL